MSPVLRPISGQDQGAFMSLWSWNGLWPAIRLSLVTGLAATLIGLAMTAALFALFQGHRIFRVFLRLVAPFLAVPHATAALALTFILAPSGWIMRGVVTLFNALGIPISQTPPDFITINDPGGLALIFGLVIKEVPFLVLMCVAAWGQCDAPRRRLVASALGYGRITGFWLTIWPVLYPQLRLPIFAVLAYSMTTVDMAMILGPSLPPSLAVQISKWITLPEPLYQGMAAAAAVVQLTLVAATLLVWRFLELMGRAISRAQFQSGIRGLSLDGPIKFFGLVFGLVGFGALIFGLLALGIWSIAGFWPYPDVLPQTYTPRVWAEAQSGVIKATQNTVILALLSTVTAVFLVLAVLQSEFLGKRTYRSQHIIYVPLLVPQITFLPGLYQLTLTAGISGQILTVAFAHFIFVLPYVALTMGPAFRAWDIRYAMVASAMGASRKKIFWQVRLPMLLRPILISSAVGIATSVAQFLPSQLIGAGRIETLTTEAVTLTSGGNRRLIGTYGLVQSLFPAIAFGLALWVSTLTYRNRRTLRAPK